MQVHISPSMRSITISTSNGFLDFMKVKVAARHLSYRTLFYTMLILAFLLPFVFILTALVTLEGVNKCSSLDPMEIRRMHKFPKMTDVKLPAVMQIQSTFGVGATEMITWVLNAGLLFGDRQPSTGH